MAFIGVDRQPPVVVVTLEDPERRNAISLAMVDEIDEAFDAIEADESLAVVVLTGQPPAFCAGAVLDELKSAFGDDGRRLRRIYDGFLRVARCPLPVIGAINGAAVGAGMNLALACDLRLVGTSGRLESRFAKIGLHPGGGHTWMLERLAGFQVAAASVLFGESFTGQACVDAGLAYRCVADDALLDEALRLAGQAGRVERELLLRTKRTMGQITALTDHGDAVALEEEPQIWSGRRLFGSSS